MMRSPDGRFGIMTPPRTASRTTRSVLGTLGWEDVASHHSICGTTVTTAERVFVVVRNHFDALASWWTAHPRNAREGRTVRKWVDNWHAKIVNGEPDGMIAYVEPGSLYGKWTRHATDLIRYEALDVALRDFGYLGAFPRINDKGSVRHGAHYSTYYDADDVDRIFDLFGEEMHALGFGFQAQLVAQK